MSGGMRLYYVKYSSNNWGFPRFLNIVCLHNSHCFKSRGKTLSFFVCSTNRMYALNIFRAPYSLKLSPVQYLGTWELYGLARTYYISVQIGNGVPNTGTFECYHININVGFISDTVSIVCSNSSWLSTTHSLSFNF